MASGLKVDLVDASNPFSSQVGSFGKAEERDARCLGSVPALGSTARFHHDLIGLSLRDSNLGYSLVHTSRLFLPLLSKVTTKVASGRRVLFSGVCVVE